MCLWSEATLHTHTHTHTDSGTYGNSIRYARGDVTKPETIEPFIAECDVLFHVAAKVSYGDHNDAQYYRVNVDGTENMLRLALKYGVQRVIVVSSAGIWAPTGDVAVSEETPLAEQQATRYTHSKYLAHLKTQEFIRQGAPVTTVLPVGVFGVDSPLFSPLLRLLRMFRMALVPDSPARISLISVAECAAGIVRAYEQGRQGECYILSGQALTLDDIVARCRPTGLWFGTVRLPLPLFRLLIRGLDMLGRLIGHVFYYNSEMLAYCTGSMVADGSKAKRELGFAQNNFEEQFAEMVSRSK
ncbi:MAG TPA: NAD-dependent epimerase/dehydratase family protein [Desulfuromonadales bacterium]|nr:NAD-dependent epimerase/dehydratase family protein [Desulfuromonadales bacterium]